MTSDLIIHDVPIECINQSAIYYNIPATLIISVLLTEGGYVGTATKNHNGTFDYGPMQVNTIWLKELAKYGIRREDIQYNACINVQVGTWILSQKIFESNEVKHGIGGYNSYSLPQNMKYRNKVTGIYKDLTHFVQAPLLGINDGDKT